MAESPNRASSRSCRCEALAVGLSGPPDFAFVPARVRSSRPSAGSIRTSLSSLRPRAAPSAEIEAPDRARAPCSADEPAGRHVPERSAVIARVPRAAVGAKARIAAPPCVRAGARLQARHRPKHPAPACSSPPSPWLNAPSRPGGLSVAEARRLLGKEAGAGDDGFGRGAARGDQGGGGIMRASCASPSRARRDCARAQPAPTYRGIGMKAPVSREPSGPLRRRVEGAGREQEQGDEEGSPVPMTPRAGSRKLRHVPLANVSPAGLRKR